MCRKRQGMIEISRFLEQGRLCPNERMEVTSNERRCFLDVTRREGQDVGMLKVQYLETVEGVPIPLFPFYPRTWSFCPFLCVLVAFTEMQEK